MHSEGTDQNSLPLSKHLLRVPTLSSVAMLNPTENVLPSLHLLLTPKATQSGNIAILQFSITIKNLPHKQGDFLCTYQQHQDDATSSRLQRFLRGIQATLRDGDGALPFSLSAEDDEGRQEIFVAREARGDILFSSEIKALGAERVASDISALRQDQGGVVGAGRYFLPWFKIDDKCHLSVEWDLSNCPEGTRAVSSLGEGPEMVEEASEHPETLLNCVFMVGSVRSNSLDDSLKEDTKVGQGGYCGTYWLGDLPKKLDAVKDYPSKIFPRMSEHFKDQGGSYRAFLRRVPKGFRSGSFHTSSIIDYDVDVEDDHDWDLVRTLNRAIASTWARLDPEDDGSENWWFTDGKEQTGENAVLSFLWLFFFTGLTLNRACSTGLALLYTVYLPFRFHQRGPDYFRATVNAFLSAYYTNPLITEPLAGLEESNRDPQNSWYAASAKTTRAFVYMLKMDAFTRRAADRMDKNVPRPIDDIVQELCIRRRQGQKVQKRDWLEAIGVWITSEESERFFREMVEDGKVNELDDMVSSFGSTYGPQPVSQAPLDFGFGRESLVTGVMTGVDSSSRAHEEGLRNSDKVTWHSRPSTCELNYEETLKLSLLRKGEQVEVEYLPRAKKTVRCWQVLERPKPSAEAS